MYNFPVYWTPILKINFLQRVILIHSYLYYEKDISLWSDKKFDETAKQLVELQNIYRDIVLHTQYGYTFYDFDGTTGFDLYHRLNRTDKEMIKKIAMNMLFGKK